MSNYDMISTCNDAVKRYNGMGRPQFEQDKYNIIHYCLTNSIQNSYQLFKANQDLYQDLMFKLADENQDEIVFDTAYILNKISKINISDDKVDNTEYLLRKLNKNISDSMDYFIDKEIQAAWENPYIYLDDQELESFRHNRGGM
ncbi:hypothetical protein UFOVP733_27 [uncultured Caudovirales phage]|uniref:Uncharacterized protein n=1 Tax=uncultured Caudovirales phage TaxID=2100421 RepID=A0A6J7X662_9CAUD|nr:hypothetical protein UFOVP733_27 [uncultured Caudovirales phage]CAB5224907.1 hypothetical protein UFOVP743_32 [uncultured Caudovirales phage]